MKNGYISLQSYQHHKMQSYTTGGPESFSAMKTQVWDQGVRRVALIFARRSIQRRLDELRHILDDDKVNKLVRRLNRPGKDRLSAMWEIVILHSLSMLGDLKHEEPVETGRRPDVAFKNEIINFIADITTISDEGVEKKNPRKTLIDELAKMRKRLGPELGGMDLRIGNKTKRNSAGERVLLRLPELKNIAKLVSEKIEPELKQQLAGGSERLIYNVDDEDVALTLKIELGQSPYDRYGFAVYNKPTIKNRNPLYNALSKKTDQLKDINGIVGIIVGDGDSGALTEPLTPWSSVSIEEIVQDFLRQNSSIYFVLVITVREESVGLIRQQDVRRSLYAEIHFQDTLQPSKHLRGLFNAMLGHMPKPIMMPVNAALRASEKGYFLGFHGGYRMSNNKISFSLREMMEILAGEKGDYPSEINKFFDKWLKEGRLPKSFQIVETDENESDKWIEIEVGDPDPAITPFK